RKLQHHEMRAFGVRGLRERMEGGPSGPAERSGPADDERGDEEASGHGAMIDEVAASRTCWGVQPCARRSRTPVSPSDLLSFLAWFLIRGWCRNAGGSARPSSRAS